MSRCRTAIFISGRGTNMNALIKAAQDPSYPAEIALVLSNKPDAKGLEIAKENGIETAVVDHKNFAGDRIAFEKQINAILKSKEIDFIALAGFMRILTPFLVNEWSGRMINIHPSLLPSFKGLNTHERALSEGVKLHGATVHYVSADMDDGPIIIQGAVPVLDDDTPEILAQRVLDVEHQIYPIALSRVVAGETDIEGMRVRTKADTVLPAPLIWP